MCGRWKCCIPPKEVARIPPDDSALRIHVALSPWAAAQRPARNLKQESQSWSRRNWRVATTIEDHREATKSGGLVQGRKDAAYRQGCRLAGSLGGRRRALISLSDRRSAHVVYDSILSSRMRDAHVGVQHTCATAHSFCGMEDCEDSILSIQRSQNAGGVARKLRCRS
jgi:hypothetical protein